MGVVYEARDAKLGRTVALKFLPPQWSHDEGAKQRFLREAQAASATNHRNICVIHDIEQTDDGQLFIVMARYEGETLKRALERGPLPVADAVDIAAEVAEGLAKAHAQGVVHRDIKPGNLMVTEDGVKILDFGLAKFADSLQLTQPGSTLGTVAYMAPEQARGEEADERSDIWALGVVLYEMLTGDCPFKGTYPEAIFYAIKNEEPAPLTAKSRDIPPGVDAIVRRALTKNPAERYQNARDLARELRFLQGRSLPLDLRTEPVDVRRAAAGTPRPTTAFTAPRLISAAVLAVAAAAGVYAWLARPLVRTPIAVVPVANHTGEPELDAYRLALTQSFIGELADSPNLRVSPYPSVLGILRRFIDDRSSAGDPSSQEAVQALATEAGASVLVVPSLEYKNGSWLAHAELRNASTGTNIAVVDTAPITSALYKETVLQLMSDLAAGVQAQFSVRWPHHAIARPVEARFRNLDAARAFEEGQNAYEEMEYTSALAAFRRAVQIDPQRAIAQAWVSRTSLVMGDRRGAEAAAQAATQRLSAGSLRGDAVFAQAVLAEAQGDLPTAERRYRELVAWHPDSGGAELELADYLKRQTQNEPAVEAYSAALRLDPATLRAHVDLCQLYSRLDNYPLSEQHAQTAITKFHALANPGGEAQALLCSGDALLQQGTRLTEARRQIEAARDMFASLGYSYALSRVFQYLGFLAGREHNYPAAAEAFTEALSRSHQAGNRPLEGLVSMNLGYTHQLMGEAARALTYYQQSRDVYQDIGDQRRAAEQDVNIADLQVTYGGELGDALRRVANARATLHKLGYLDFEVGAMQVQAEGEMAAGRMAEALRLLREASSLATERQLKNRLASLRTSIGNVQILQGDFAGARQALEQVVAGEGATPEAKIALGRACLRIGDFVTAKKWLEEASSDARRTGEAGIGSLAEESLGELAYESGDVGEARARFANAAAAQGADDSLSAPAAMEARCRLGALDSRAAAADREHALIAIVGRTSRLGRRVLEAECRLDLARVQLAARRHAAALDTLRPVQSEGDIVLGPELDAQAHHLRAEALAGQGDQQAASRQRSSAKALVAQMQGRLPEDLRQRFGLRAGIRPLLD